MSLPADPAEALRRLAREPDLCCLDGGDAGWTYIFLPGPCQPLADVTELPSLSTGSADTSASGWPAELAGGALLQLDYEFPVGPHAARLPQGSRPPGSWWPLTGGLAFPPGAVPPRWIGAADERLRQALATDPLPLPEISLEEAVTPAWDGATHAAKVADIVAHIAAGDLFQANLTLPFRGRLVADPAMDVAVYLALRQHSPAPYACLMRQHGRTVISHSPECFIQGSGSGSAAQIRSEPIKGTRRRQPGYEAAVVAELLASAKDRAELAMIVDLVRNDLGRVARPGSVSVREAARVMDLDYVHHLVATVEACCEPADHQALLAAAFPPGSITGAPKIAAMELIAQLETGPRGPYCGTFGWLGADGACALAVAIRTMVIEADGQLALHAGGGIVADSDGESEWAEVLAKADRMLHSLGAGL